MWAIALKDTVNGQIRLVEEDNLGGLCDLKRFERHIVPFTEVGDEMRFGVHDFTRNCICRPRIDVEDGYEMIVHEDRKPN